MARKKTGTTTGLMTPKSKINLSLTEKAMEIIETMMKETGLNRSALFESILTGNLSLSSQNSSVSDNKGNENTSDNEVSEVANNIINQELEQQKKLIENLELEVNKQHNLVSEKEKINLSLTESLQQKEEIIKSLENQLKNDPALGNKDRELQSIKNQLEEVNQTLKLKDDEIRQLSEVKSLLADKVKIIEELTQKNDHLEQQLKQINEDQAKLINTDKQAEEVKFKSDNLQRELTKKNDDFNILNQQLFERENLIRELNKQIQSQKEAIEKLEMERNNVRYHYEQHQQSMESKLNSINEQQKLAIHHLESRIAQLETTATIGEQMLNKWRSKSYN